MLQQFLHRKAGDHLPHGLQAGVVGFLRSLGRHPVSTRYAERSH